LGYLIPKNIIMCLYLFHLGVILLTEEAK